MWVFSDRSRIVALSGIFSFMPAGTHYKFDCFKFLLYSTILSNYMVKVFDM